MFISAQERTVQIWEFGYSYSSLTGHYNVHWCSAGFILCQEEEGAIF